MPNGHLVCHLLDLDFLERDKFGGPSREEQLALRIVLLAFLGQAFGKREELLGGDGLEHLASASVASVRVDLNGGLDV